MRRLCFAFLALFLCGCAGATPVVVGPDPAEGQGFRFVAHINGEFDGQGFAYANPITALVRGYGNLTLTARAMPPPFLVIDGDINTIVEPLPGKEMEAMTAVRAGHILIRRSGVAGDLNQVGSRASYISSLVRRPATPSIPNPPAEPPSFPASTPPAGIVPPVRENSDQPK